MDQQCPFTGNLCSACIEGACQYRDLSRQLKLKSRALAKKRAAPNLSPTNDHAVAERQTPAETGEPQKPARRRTAIWHRGEKPIEPSARTFGDAFYGLPAPNPPVEAPWVAPPPLRFTCEACGGLFETSPELVRHVCPPPPLPPAPPLWACDGCGAPFATFFELSRHKEKDCLATTPTPPPPLDPPSPPQQTAPIEPLRWGAPAPGEPMWRYGGTKGPVPNWFCDGCGASFETSPELVRHCQTGCPKPLRPRNTRIRAE